jgi:hypothetical protein
MLIGCGSRNVVRTTLRQVGGQAYIESPTFGTADDYHDMHVVARRRRVPTRATARVYVAVRSRSETTPPPLAIPMTRRRRTPFLLLVYWCLSMVLLPPATAQAPFDPQDSPVDRDRNGWICVVDGKDLWRGRRPRGRRVDRRSAHPRACGHRTRNGRSRPRFPRSLRHRPRRDVERFCDRRRTRLRVVRARPSVLLHRTSRHSTRGAERPRHRRGDHDRRRRRYRGGRGSRRRRSLHRSTYRRSPTPRCSGSPRRTIVGTST